MKKYYYDTEGINDDHCTQECQCPTKPSEGTCIGSVKCQECVNFIESDQDDCWIKCGKLSEAVIGEQVPITAYNFVIRDGFYWVKDSLHGELTVAECSEKEWWIMCVDDPLTGHNFLKEYIIVAEIDKPEES